MSELLYCSRCWSPNDNLLGVDRTTWKCCKACPGGRARAYRHWQAIQRERRWAALKERYRKEAMELFGEDQEGGCTDESR